MIYNKLTWFGTAIQSKTWSVVNLKKHLTMTSSKLEAVIWSSDAG